MAKAKPFVKWAGGKGQLLEQLDAYLPENFGDRKNVTYIEPFVGGGAMLFYMLQRYPNIHHVVINDVNPDLTTCYQTVTNPPARLLCFTPQTPEHRLDVLPSETPCENKKKS